MPNSQHLLGDTYRLVVFVLLFIIGYHYLNDNRHDPQPTNSGNTVIESKQLEVQKASYRESPIKVQKVENLSVVKTSDQIPHTSKDLYCLAKNIYHEAGQESTKGKYAVAQVTINRSKDNYFKGTICQVVMAANQFSWTRNKKLRDKEPQGSAWQDSLAVARATLQDGFRVQGLENALYFHATRVNPGWRNVIRIAQIGAHVFYRPAR